MRPYQFVTIVFYAVLAVLLLGWQLYGTSWWLIVVWVIIYIHMLVLGAVFIRWDFYVKAYHSGGDAGKIALSFDDGPAGETAAILDVLKEQEVTAAFFCIGKNVTAHPEMVARMLAEGHVAGNHSYLHGFGFDWKSKKEMIEEINQTNDALNAMSGRKNRLFRPPYGVTNPNLARAICATGMYAIGWSLRSFDTKAKAPQELLDRIVGKVKSGDIILLHDSQQVTREILTELIIRCREKGFTFVRPDELLGIPAYE